LITASNKVQTEPDFILHFYPDATFLDNESKLIKEMKVSSLQCSRLSTKYSDMIWYEISVDYNWLTPCGSSKVHIYI